MGVSILATSSKLVNNNPIKSTKENYLEESLQWRVGGCLKPHGLIIIKKT